jgi:hypothetical protein
VGLGAERVERFQLPGWRLSQPAAVSLRRRFTDCGLRRVKPLEDVRVNVGGWLPLPGRPYDPAFISVIVPWQTQQDG